jgi:hypothetical protein
MCGSFNHVRFSVPRSPCLAVAQGFTLFFSSTTFMMSDAMSQSDKPQDYRNPGCNVPEISHSTLENILTINKALFKILIEYQVMPPPPPNSSLLPRVEQQLVKRARLYNLPKAPVHQSPVPRCDRRLKA